MHDNDSTTQSVIGRQFGVLTVIGMERPKRWTVQCECGQTKTLQATRLLGGYEKSCGCRRYDPIGSLRRTHGRSKTPEFNSWQGMRGRCLNTRNHAFSKYGGRGITICDRWRDSFENFYADMGDRPSNTHSIDRVDNDGPYSPENCRWADQIQQNHNRSVTRRYTHAGRTLTLSEWAAEIGTTYDELRKRVRTKGWTFERALTEATRSKGA